MTKVQLSKGDHMKKQFVGNHGDVGFFKLDKLPEGAEFVGKVTRHVAQEGETTGHKHLMTSSAEFDVYKVVEQGADSVVIERWAYLLSAPTEITHEEHPRRVLEPGIYIQEQENEEHPWTDLIVKVVD
jgi:hypothetical protein